MIATTYSGQSVLILNDSPDWVERPKHVVEGVTQYEESLSGRESRRGYSQVLRSRLSFRITMDSTQSIPFAALLRTYQTQPVICPVWPTATTWADRATIPFSGLRIAYKADWSQYEIYTTTEPTWPLSTDNVVHVLFGRLDKRELVWDNATTASFSVSFVETGTTAQALTPTGQTLSSGPAISGSTAYLLNQRFDAGQFRENFSLRILEEQIGFTRSQIETLYPQTNARESTLSCIGSSIGDFAKALHFATLHFTGQSFWVPSLRSGFLLASDVSAGSSSVTATTTPGIVANDYLWFFDSDQSDTNRTRKVSSVVGTTVNLTSTVGPLTASQTVCAPLVLARLDKPRLEFEWLNASTVQWSVEYVEVPPEYATPGDETANTTLGGLAVRAFLYELSQTIGGVSVVTRATSHEQSLTSGSAYSTRKIDHGTIRQSINLDRDEVELRSEIISGDPLLLLATSRCETPITLTIKRCDVSGTTVSNVSVIFTGDIVSCSVRGSKITARAVSAGTVFDRLYPRFRMQVGCNHSLFSTGCGLAKASLKFTATMPNPYAGGYPFGVSLTSLARVSGVMPTITAGWFGGGWIEFGSGATVVTRAILTNTAAVSGALTVTLARDAFPYPAAGSSVALYPGCDGAFDTCKTKFANGDNFGGHPFIPPSNPSLVKMTKNISGSKK